MDMLHQLFDNIKTLFAQAKNENRGRPRKKTHGRPFPDEVATQTALIVLLATLKGWTIHQTHRNLTGRDATWRHLLGICLCEIPPRRTLSNRWKHPLVWQWQQCITKRMFRRLLNQRNLYVVCVDMSDLPSGLYDTLANWGVCGKGHFHGYKLHLLVTRDGIPLGLVITKANRRETAVTDRLLARVAQALTDDQTDSLVLLMGDKAYDSKPAADQAKQRLSVQMIAPANPRRSQELKGELTTQTKKKLKERGTNRDKAILLYESRRGKELFRKCRITIEQVIDQLKNDLGLERLPYWVRGVRKVQKRVQNAVFAYLCILFCNKLHRRPLRQVAPYLV
jgi:hypothetical protein